MEDNNREAAENDLRYAQGPRGEIVVITPTNQDFTTSEAKDHNRLRLCVFIWIIIGYGLVCAGLLLCLMGYFESLRHGYSILTGYITVGIGFGLMVPSLPLWCYLRRRHGQQVSRHLYTNDGGPQSPSIDGASTVQSELF